MKPEDFFKKAHADVNDIMDSISAVKGEKFARLVALHINYCTLVTLTNLLKQEDCDPALAKAITKTAVLCATSSLETLCRLCDFTEAEIKEIIDWGERIEKQINSTFKQMKEQE